MTASVLKQDYPDFSVLIGDYSENLLVLSCSNE